MKGVDYSKNTVPNEYKCKKCKAFGVKLWREYQTNKPNLLCYKCASESQHENVSTITADGYHIDRFGDKTDQIGYYVPAIPDEEGYGYWGYTSVPDAGVNWWKQLPL